MLDARLSGPIPKTRQTSALLLAGGSQPLSPEEFPEADFCPGLTFRFACRSLETYEQGPSEELPLLQLGVLALRLPVDGDVRVGVLPEREEVFVCG